MVLAMTRVIRPAWDMKTAHLKKTWVFRCSDGKEYKIVAKELKTALWRLAYDLPRAMRKPGLGIKLEQVIKNEETIVNSK